jgi:hypothetical protein
MDLSELSPEKFIFSLGLAVLLNLIFVRKLVFSILDPWVLLFFNQMMILAVIIYSFLSNNISSYHFIFFIVSWFSFITGLYVFKNSLIYFNFKARTVLNKVATAISLNVYLFIFCVNAILIFILMGIPLLSSQSRTISDYSNMGTGYGLFYYLNWGLQEIIKLLSLKSWLIDKKRKSGLFALSILIVFNILNGGSRAMYLDIILYFGLGIFYLRKFKNLTVKTPIFFKVALVLLPFFILFSFKSAVIVGYESNVVLAFIKRTIGTAEGPFYYFIKNAYSGFSGLNLISYHLSGILPYFGYIDKNAIDLGVNLTAFSDLNFGTAGYGPNPTMYVVGHIALGSYGFIYCFLIGVVLSFFRYRFKANFLLWMLLNYLLTSLVVDGTLMFLSLFYIVLISPVFIFVFYMLSRTSPTINYSRK